MMDARKMENFSNRGWSNIETVMRKIGAPMDHSPVADEECIDLSTAENWLLREDLLRLCQNTIAKKLMIKVIFKALPIFPSKTNQQTSKE